MSSESSSPDDEFVRQLTSHQQRLYGLVMSMLPDPDAARDVLQEANVVLWRKHGEYTPGTNFGAWAAKVAYFQVAAYRKAKGRDRLFFDDDLLLTFASEAESRFRAHGDRSVALEACLDRLSDRDREILRKRYTEGSAVTDLAATIGKSASATRVALFRLRNVLLECIQAKVAAKS